MTLGPVGIVAHPLSATKARNTKKKRKPRGMMQVPNPNPREGGMIWVPKKTKAEKVEFKHFVPKSKENRKWNESDTLD